MSTVSDQTVMKEKKNSKNAAEDDQKLENNVSSKTSDSSVNDTFLKRYKVIEKIGEGSYSEVLKCHNQSDGSTVACKRLKHIYKSWTEVNNIAEIATLRTMEKHVNILQMIEIHYDITLGKVSLVFELMDVNLYELIKDRKRLDLCERILPESRVRTIMFQLFKALRHLHKVGIFHRDIKPENILIRTKTDQLKLGDLGSVRGMFSKAPYTEYISTRWYRSPECLLTSGHYSHKMDIWAAGCVFYEVLTLRPLFPGTSEIDQINRINNILGPPPLKLLETFQKQADIERDSYKGQTQLNRRQQIHKVLDSYSSRYIVANDSKSYSSKSIRSNRRNAVEYHFAGREGIGLDKHLPSHVSREAKEIIRACLSYDPEMRPTAHKILHLSYFYELRDNYSKNSEKLSSRPVLTICGEKPVEECGIVELRTLGDNKIHLRRSHLIKASKQASKLGMQSVKTITTSKLEINGNYLKGTSSSKENGSPDLSSSRVSNLPIGRKQSAHYNVNVSSVRKTTNSSTSKDKRGSPSTRNKERRDNNSSKAASINRGSRNQTQAVEPEVSVKIQTKEGAPTPLVVIHSQKQSGSGVISNRAIRAKNPPSNDTVNKGLAKKKSGTELYPKEMIDFYSARYRGPDANMNILKTSSNYVKLQDSRARVQDVKEKLNLKIEQRRRRQINSPSIGDHPSKLNSTRGSELFLNSNEYSKQVSPTMLATDMIRATDERQYPKQTESKNERVERKIVGLRSSGDMRSNRANRDRSHERNPVPRRRDESTNAYQNHTTHRSFVPVKALERKDAGERKHMERRSYSNISAAAELKEFRDKQRKRTERPMVLKDEVFCSSDDDAVATMRKRFDSLISERARKLSECLKTNLVAEASNNDFGKACDSDDDLLPSTITPQLRNTSLSHKAKKYARRELRARMAESLTMSNRFTSMNWRLSADLQEAGHHNERFDYSSRDCTVQSTYNDSVGQQPSTYMQPQPTDEASYRDSYQNNLQYQRHFVDQESNRIHSFSRQEHSNGHGKMYTPPGSKPVYHSPLGGGMLHDRNLRYTHNMQVPRNSNNTFTNHSNYSQQRLRYMKDSTANTLKNRQR